MVNENIPSLDPTVWVDLHGDYLFAYALSRLHDQTVAEDVVQETFLAALEATDSYAGRSSVRTWLTGILKHKIIDFFRRNRKHESFDETEFSEIDRFFKREGEWNGHWSDRYVPIEWRDNPAENLERREFQNVLNKCLSKLPGREASVFTLREMEGLSSKEICELLSISTNNFWVIIHRARMNLSKCLEFNWFKKAEVQ